MNKVHFSYLTAYHTNTHLNLFSDSFFTPFLSDRPIRATNLRQNQCERKISRESSLETKANIKKLLVFLNERSLCKFLNRFCHADLCPLFEDFTVLLHNYNFLDNLTTMCFITFNIFIGAFVKKKS